MRRLFVVQVALLAAGAVQASYPVFDASNYAKMVQTVQLMQRQVEQMQATYQAVSGSRGLGALFYNPALRQYLPEQWTGIYDAVSAGAYAGISGNLRDIRQAEALAGTVAEQIAQVQARQRNAAVANKAIGLRAYDGAKARLQQIEKLMAQINLTKDSKGVAEFQARIAVEQAAVANEATKLQLMGMLQQTEERLAAQQRQQIAQKILSADNTGMPACCATR